MPVRPVVDGKTKDVAKAYVVQDGAIKRTNKIYLPDQNGKTALYWTRKGLPGNPFLIQKSADLEWIAQDPSACFELGRSFVFGESEYHSYFPLLPPDVPFTGTLDGNNRQISVYANDLVVEGSSDGYHSPLFCKNLGTIRRLSLSAGNTVKFFTDVTEEGNAYGGGIAGLNEGTIEQCLAKFWVKESDICYWGGIAGLNRGNMIDIKANIRTSGGYPIAGLTNVNEGRMINAVGACWDFSSSGRHSAYMLVNENRESGYMQSCFCDRPSNYHSTGKNSGIFKDVFAIALPYNDKAKFPGFDFEDIWRISNNTYTMPSLNYLY